MVQSYREMTGTNPPHTRNPQLDNGVPGSFYSSHAEVQQLHAHLDAPGALEMGVNKDMCGSCRRAVRAAAQRSGREITVADPSYVRRFHPDGSVDIYPVDSPANVIRVRKGIEPSVDADAPHSAYTGNPF